MLNYNNIYISWITLVTCYTLHADTSPLLGSDPKFVGFVEILSDVAFLYFWPLWWHYNPYLFRHYSPKVSYNIYSLQ